MAVFDHVSEVNYIMIAWLDRPASRVMPQPITHRSLDIKCNASGFLYVLISHGGLSVKPYNLSFQYLNELCDSAGSKS